jgi:hypothetical protein
MKKTRSDIRYMHGRTVPAVPSALKVAMFPRAMTYPACNGQVIGWLFRHWVRGALKYPYVRRGAHVEASDHETADEHLVGRPFGHPCDQPPTSRVDRSHRG